MIYKSKKQAVDLTDMAVGILVIGLVVTIGATVLLNIQAGRLTSLDEVTTTNESFLASDGGTTLDNVWYSSLGKITNATDGATIPATNYTITTDANNGIATVDFVASSLHNGSNVFATYNTYNTSRADYALAGSAATGLAEFGNWFNIIVIVGIAAVILSLIFMAFGNRGESGVSY